MHDAGRRAPGRRRLDQPRSRRIERNLLHQRDVVGSAGLVHRGSSALQRSAARGVSRRAAAGVQHHVGRFVSRDARWELRARDDLGRRFSGVHGWPGRGRQRRPPCVAARRNRSRHPQPRRACDLRAVRAGRRPFPCRAAVGASGGAARTDARVGALAAPGRFPGLRIQRRAETVAGRRAMGMGCLDRGLGADDRLGVDRKRKSLACRRRGLARAQVDPRGVVDPQLDRHLVGIAGRQLGAGRAHADAGFGSRLALVHARLVRSLSAVSFLRAHRGVQPADVARAPRACRSQYVGAIRAADVHEPPDQPRGRHRHGTRCLCSRRALVRASRGDVCGRDVRAGDAVRVLREDRQPRRTVSVLVRRLAGLLSSCASADGAARFRRPRGLRHARRLHQGSGVRTLPADARRHRRAVVARSPGCRPKASADRRAVRSAPAVGGSCGSRVVHRRAQPRVQLDWLHRSRPIDHRTGERRPTATSSRPSRADGRFSG